MNIAEVKKIRFDTPFPDLDTISAALDRLKERHHIDTLNWKGYNYKPPVEFAIAYGDEEIFLKYYVTEEYFKAEKQKQTRWCVKTHALNSLSLLKMTVYIIILS